jgi:hypothetical protein
MEDELKEIFVLIRMLSRDKKDSEHTCCIDYMNEFSIVLTEDKDGDQSENKGLVEICNEVLSEGFMDNRLWLPCRDYYNDIETGKCCSVVTNIS